MKLRELNPLSIDPAAREVWRAQELSCNGSPEVQAVMLYAVAKAISRPVEMMPKPEPNQLWRSFKAAIDCKSIKLADLPLWLLSPGERFGLAVGTLFNADHLPAGETFLELVDSATGSGCGPAGIFTLGTVLGLPTVQAVVPASALEFHGANLACDLSDDEVMARAREALGGLD